MYFNTNFDSTIKIKNSIELENAIICRVLLSRSNIDISLNTTSSKTLKNLISAFNISHQKLLLKHAGHYNHCICTLGVWICSDCNVKHVLIGISDD